MKIALTESVTLDGLTPGPGSPDEEGEYQGVTALV
jgi:hypothetical protein